jgi:hypothetical protein
VLPPFTGVAVNVTAVPAHIEVELAIIVTAGVSELTLTRAVPENTPMQFASLTAAMLYVLDVAGDTTKSYGDTVMLFTVTDVDPSEYVTDHGEVPVSAIEIVADPPMHIDASPLITAVGIGLILISNEVVLAHWPASGVKV